jgi:hypothetical protein
LRLVLVPLALLGVLVALGVASRDEPREEVAPPEIRLEEVARFEQPVYVTSPPRDDRLFVVERTGRVWIWTDGRRLPRPFLDLSKRISVSGYEEGLLSLAFAPDYATSGLLYVDYTDLRHRSVVEEFRRGVDPNVADPRSARRVLVIPNPTENHHGGLVLFGPDGYLYVGQGDGGTYRDRTFPAQRLDELHGKILRIDPRRHGGRSYRSPSDNPYVGRPGRDEVWLSGLRNPWRFAFDPASGALVIGDVGALIAEEIDVAPRAGMNFGWSCREGRAPYEPGGPPSCGRALAPAVEFVRGSLRAEEPDGKEPVVTRGRPRVSARLTTPEPLCSVVAGVFVQDPALPSLAGRHLYGDFCETSLRSFRLEGQQAVEQRVVGSGVPLLSSFGVDSAGRVYVTSLTGALYRVKATR